MKRSLRGFTIVELLIIIVVIAILAAISIMAYTGIQQRARDSRRSSDITAITKALELYYIDKGTYPSCNGSGTTAMVNPWCTTADSSWSFLAQKLSDYATSLPKDPISNQGVNIITTPNTYDYIYYGPQYCSASGIAYILSYRYEATTQKHTLVGTCNDYYGGMGPYSGLSNYRVVK